MKQIFTFLVVFLMSASLFAQDRYLDEIFTEVEVTEDVVYGQNWDYYENFPELTADIYTPVGDTETERPLIIVMHAGSFLPISILPFGNNRDPHLVEMCNQWAKRGWTVASINYRLGWNPLSSEAEVRSGTIMQAVYRSMLDLKTAVRFFRKSAAEGNPYNIDANKIVGAGTNSGGYCVVAAATLNKPEEIMLEKFLDGNLEPFIDTSVLGEFDGSGGADGFNNYQWGEYSSDINMALNLGGAIGDISWIEAGEVPIVSAHGVIEELTPYDTDIVVVSLTGQPVVEVSGSRDVTTRQNELGNLDMFADINPDVYTQAANANFAVEDGNGEGCYLFRNKGFEPWGYYNCSYGPAVDDGDPETMYCSSSLQNELVNGSVETYITNEDLAAPYIDTIMNYFAPRAMIVLELPGFDDLTSTTTLQEANINVYPNPATDYLFIDNYGSNQIKKVEVYSLDGKLVNEFSNLNGLNTSININDLNAGIYLLKLITENGIIHSKFTK